MSETSARVTRKELDVLFQLCKSAGTESPVQLPRLGMSEGEELFLIRKRLLELRLARMDGQGIVLTALGRLYADFASDERSKRYLFLCFAMCALLFSALAYKLLLAL